MSYILRYWTITSKGDQLKQFLAGMYMCARDIKVRVTLNVVSNQITDVFFI